MKKSHLLITILVFICFFICGCNNTKTNDIEVLDNFKKVKDVAPKGTYDAYVGKDIWLFIIILVIIVLFLLVMKL
jgi:hypothetical protein